MLTGPQSSFYGQKVYFTFFSCSSNPAYIKKEEENIYNAKLQRKKIREILVQILTP